MSKARISLPMQMAIGMGLGIVAGMLAQGTSLGADVFKPLGDLFIRLIRMVVVPLVFTTLVAGAAGIIDTSKLGRVAVKTLIFYVVCMAASVIVGLVVANVINPGYGLSISTESLKAKSVTPPKLVTTLMELIPMNPMDAMAKGNMLQIIIFAIIFGFGITALGEKGRFLQEFFERCGDVMIKVTGFVMLYAPIGIFGLIAYTVTAHGLSVLLPLAKVIAAMYIACVIVFLLVYTPLLLFLVRMPIGKFMSGLAEPLLIAFSTCSSAAALPANMRSTRRLGASKAVTSFSIPLGNTINMDGTAVYMGVATIFVAQVYGIPMTVTTMITVVAMSILAAIGSMGVPGAGLIMISIVFVQVGIPLEGVALVAGIDRVLDMARTTMNIMGDSLGALVVSKLEGDLNTEPWMDEEESSLPKSEDA